MQHLTAILSHLNNLKRSMLSILAIYCCYKKCFCIFFSYINFNEDKYFVCHSRSINCSSASTLFFYFSLTFQRGLRKLWEHQKDMLIYQ